MDVNANNSVRIGAALGLGLSHVAVAVLLQLQVGVIYLREGAFSGNQLGTYLLWLPVSQFSVLAFAVVLAALLWIVAGSRAGRGLGYVIALLMNAALCLGQAAVLTIGQFPAPTLLADLAGSAAFLSDAAARTLPVLSINILVAVFITAFLPRVLQAFSMAAASLLQRPAAQSGLLIFFGVQLAAAAASPYGAIAAHPVYATLATTLHPDGLQRAAQQPVWNVFNSGLGARPHRPDVAFSAAQDRQTVFVLYRADPQLEPESLPGAIHFASVHMLELSASNESVSELAADIRRRIEALNTNAGAQTGSAQAEVFDLTDVSAPGMKELADVVSKERKASFDSIPAELAMLRDALAGQPAPAVWLIGIPPRSRDAGLNPAVATLWKAQDSALQITVFDRLPRDRLTAWQDTPYSLDDLLTAYHHGGPPPTGNVFFRSRNGTPVWGLRDGRWKYLAGVYANGARLFDIREDPFELNNLAPEHPARVDYYNRLLASRFSTFGGAQQALQANDGYVNDRPPALGYAFGPKVMSFSADSRHRVRFDEGERPVLELSLLPYASNARLVSQWAGPAGERLSYTMPVAQRWSRYRFTPGLTPPLSPGQWQVVVKLEDTALLGGDFFVVGGDGAGLATNEGFRLGKRVYREETGELAFTPTVDFFADELPRVRGSNERTEIRWRSVWWPPRAAAMLGSDVYPGPRPLRTGRWRVQLIAEGGKPISEFEFEVKAAEGEG